MTSKEQGTNRLVWWGRSDIAYARNGVIRGALRDLGLHILDFKPRLSFAGYIEAAVLSLSDVDAIWVPCFRQRDLAAASKWAKKKNIPLIFDPMISAYDKQVFERRKFPEKSAAAKKLLQWESKLFQLVDVMIADTSSHAKYYEEQLGVDSARIHVVPVSAEEELFTAKVPVNERSHDSSFKVLFYGNYLELHGADVIADAILENTNSSIKWILAGDGATRNAVEKKCKDVSSVHFIDWIEYSDLHDVIHSCDLVLGIFGTTQKATRVIPNKVFQAMACGRPVVTMRSDAYPKALRESHASGLYWVEPGNPSDLLCAIDRVMNGVHRIDCAASRASYDKYFSNETVRKSLGNPLRQAFAAKSGK